MNNIMTNSKLSRWLKSGAFTLIACAAIAVLSTEQAAAQSYLSGNRGISISSFGRGGGFNLSVGSVGPNYGYRGGSFKSGFGGPGKYYGPSYRGSGGNYYRSPAKYYGKGGGFSSGRGGFGPQYYGRGRY